MTAERVLMALLLGGIAIGCVLVLYPFFSAILWAAILAYTTWPLYDWIRRHGHLGHRASAAVMVLLTAVVLVLPLALAVPGGVDDIDQLRKVVIDALQAGLPAPPRWLWSIPIVGPSLGELLDSWAADINAMVAFFKPYFGAVAEFGLRIVLGVANGILDFLLAIVIAFFFFAAGDRLAAVLTAVLYRIAGGRAERLIAVTGATMRGVVYGLLGTAIVQGILTTFGLWVSGVPRPMLLGLIAGSLSVLPIGAPVVWIPAAIWLATTGHTAWGIILFVYGIVCVSGADNVIRPFFIARGAQLPFLLTLLGVLGGAIAFGLLGIFVGPVLIGVGFTLVSEFAQGNAPELDGDITPSKVPETATAPR
jgi:predicted PurR-regulated permease PerM